MNRFIWPVLALALLATSPTPTPLVAGSVRDVTGRPVAGATVSGRTANGTVVTDTTATDGTFALEGNGLITVRVSCRFCQAVQVPVGSDGTVVAIVRRFEALEGGGPTPEDLAALPYDRVESDLALAPFTILENSKGVIPGPQVSKHVLQSGGGLIVDAGLPTYDISTGLSQLLTTPARYIQSVAALPQSDAFAYGDLADDGSFAIDPGGQGHDATLTAGDGLIARAGLSNDTLALSGGSSSDGTEQRRRADAAFTSPIPQGQIDLALTGSDERSFRNLTNDVNAGFVGVHADAERTQSFTERLEAYADRGSYGAQYFGYALRSSWSDSGASFSVHADTNVAPFATLGVRTSAGNYDAASLGIPGLAATLAQVQAIAGVGAQAKTYDITVAIGGYNLTYAGGSYGKSVGASTFVGSPTIDVRLTPDDHWSFDLSQTGSFRLPTFAERYGDGNANYLAIDHDSTFESTLGYTDTSRVTYAVTALVRNTHGLDTGRIASVGESIAWQIDPNLSLRTWWMHVAPNQTADDDGLHFGAAPRTANVGSAWLSYQAGAGLRIDAIWRQDLLNYVPDAHLDESLSTPLTARLRWYVGSERLVGVRSITAGINFLSP